MQIIPNWKSKCLGIFLKQKAWETTIQKMLLTSLRIERKNVEANLVLIESLSKLIASLNCRHLMDERGIHTEVHTLLLIAGRRINRVSTVINQRVKWVGNTRLMITAYFKKQPITQMDAIKHKLWKLLPCVSVVCVCMTKKEVLGLQTRCGKNCSPKGGSVF